MEEGEQTMSTPVVGGGGGGGGVGVGPVPPLSVQTKSSLGEERVWPA